MQESATEIDRTFWNAVAGVIAEAGPPDFHRVQDYHLYCRKVCREWGKVYGNSEMSPQFAEHRALVNEGAHGTVRTPWGGYTITNHQHPNVEKYIVIDSGRYLPFERHDEKVETIVCLAGVGVLVYRPRGKKELVAEPVVPNYSQTLQPGQEHCLVSLDHLLVFERSAEPKGLGHDDMIIWDCAS